MWVQKKKIKVSEEERLRRKDLDLPVTKPLRYMQHLPGRYVEHQVVAYQIVDETIPKGKRTLLVTIYSGEQIRIYEPYFAHMQKPSFAEDMAAAMTGNGNED